MAQLKVIYFINSLTWSYLVFLVIYLIVGKVFLPYQIKAQWLRNKLQ